jgi:hypothetical protein
MLRPPEAPAAPPAHAVVGTFAMRVRPSRGTVEIRRVSEEIAKSGGIPGFGPENFDNLPIVSDGTAGSGPDYTVELATDDASLVNTYNKGAVGSCPANSFCGDVTLTHFYPGINLSGVYVQIYDVTGANNTPLSGHDAANGVGSTPFGIDLTRGAWQYTTLGSSGTTIAKGAGVKKTWALKNPDNADSVLWLRVLASYYPMVWFSSTTGVTQTAPLVAGQPASVHYEYARNTSCRGTNWIMNGFLKGFNVDQHQTSFPGNATDTYFDIHMVLPFGPGLDFWFNNEDQNGCKTWDSNGGNNYNFAMADTNTRIHFAGYNANNNPYWTTAGQVYKDSGVAKGVTIGVDYEINRVLCGSLDRYGRVPTGTSVLMWYNFDSFTGTYTKVDLLGTPYGVASSVNGVAGKVYVAPTIALPSNISKLYVYFESTDGNGCHKYDSNGGANWVFNL